MARPTVQKQLELPAGVIPFQYRVRLRLVAAVPGPGVGYSTAQTADIVGDVTHNVDSTGLVSFTNVRPNSGGSADVITSPVGTVYEVATMAPGAATVVEYISVPDGAGPYFVQALLTNPPGTLFTDTEGIQDVVGAMVTGSVQTGITVTYQDATGKIDFAATGGHQYTGTIGDGASTSIAVTHGLGSTNVTVTARDASTGAEVAIANAATSANVVTFTFATAPATNAYAVQIIAP